MEISCGATLGRGFRDAKLCPPQNRSNHVVEVMGDPTRKLSDRLELFELAHSLFGTLVLPPPRYVFELSSDGRQQARGIAFHHVVVSAKPHGFNGGFLTDGAGDENERNIQPSLTDDLERRGPAEAWHGVIRNNNVPLTGGQESVQ